MHLEKMQVVASFKSTLGEMEVVADSLTFKHLSEYVFAFQILNMYTVALILFFIF